MLHTIEQGLVEAYADVTGDQNPLHVDPAFAAATPYGGTIAHGLLVAAITTDSLLGEREPAPPYELEILFLRPVPTGTTIDVEEADIGGDAAVATVDGKPAVVVRLHALSPATQDGEAL